MKTILTLFTLLIICAAADAQKKLHKADPNKKTQIVEASCGQCNFDMKEEGCALAVRINGTPYFVNGSSIDEYGDAHAKNGFCNAIRKAEVQGEIKDGKFAATYFKLLPVAKKKKRA